MNNFNKNLFSLRCSLGGLLYFLKTFSRLILSSFTKTTVIIIIKAKTNGAQLIKGSGEKYSPGCLIILTSIIGCSSAIAPGLNLGLNAKIDIPITAIINKRAINLSVYSFLYSFTNNSFVLTNSLRTFGWMVL